MNDMERSGHDPAYDQAQPGRYFGKYPGVVVDPGKQQGQSKHIGQIKVRVPGILEETPDGQSNQPIEVIASPSFLPGFFFVPEKDDPVWVEFVAGDINFPIWSGVWYPADKGAPQTFDGNDPTEKQRIIHTKKDHVIQIDDTDNSEAIVIKDKTNGNTITLHKDETKIESKGASVVLGKDSLTITCGSGTLSISNSDMTIKWSSNSIKLSDQGIEITGPAPGTVKLAQTGVQINGQAALLAPLLQWLMAHQHTGNLGAPAPALPIPNPPMPGFGFGYASDQTG